MRFNKHILFILCLCFFTIRLGAQEPKKQQSLKSERRIRKELRRESTEKRRKERAERKAVKKYHKRLQTKKVRKRMKSSKKSAIRYNEHKREFFIIRWFKKKKRV